MLTDKVSDLLFVTCLDAKENLLREGVAADKIHFVGNPMIDSLATLLPHCAGPSGIDLPSRYTLVTLHRPSNVDDPEWLKEALTVLAETSRELPVLFPMHPRTQKRIGELGLNSELKGIQLMDPLPYLEFVYLQKNAAVVITDSGGVQEETTFLGVPCLTVRENTERPVTVELGTNKLVGRDLRRLRVELERVLAGDSKSGSIPPLWDGHAAERIAHILCAKSVSNESLQTPCRA